MKSVIKLSIALVAMTIAACTQTPQETYTKSRTVEDGGTGPYTALAVEEPSLEAHTLLRPADLTPFGKDNLLPVLVWGNGACTNSPWEHIKFLSEIASHGFLVVATGFFPEDDDTPYHGPMSTSEQQIEAIDWVFAVNADKTSPYFGKLDTDNIALAGMSCGGLQTLANAGDLRLKTIMICNSGLFINPGTAIPGMPMPEKDQLQNIHTPTMYILGGPDDIAYTNGMDDYSRINHVPVFAANYPVGHGGTYRQEHGGEFSIVATAWLQWQLKGDEQAASLFKGDPCGLASRPGWTVDKKNMD